MGATVGAEATGTVAVPWPAWGPTHHASEEAMPLLHAVPPPSWQFGKFLFVHRKHFSEVASAEVRFALGGHHIRQGPPDAEVRQLRKCIQAAVPTHVVRPSTGATVGVLFAFRSCINAHDRRQREPHAHAFLTRLSDAAILGAAGPSIALDGTRTVESAQG